MGIILVIASKDEANEGEGGWGRWGREGRSRFEQNYYSGKDK